LLIKKNGTIYVFKKKGTLRPHKRKGSGNLRFPEKEEFGGYAVPWFPEKEGFGKPKVS
jgi:hypothetical protein